jgi:hypothetical protein
MDQPPRPLKESDMANADIPATVTTNTPATSVSPSTVALFQKAHAKMVTLQRVDEQLVTLSDQRRKLKEELRALQTQINDEFNRLVLTAEDPVAAAAIPATPARRIPASPFTPDLKPKRLGSAKDPVQLEIAKAV